MATNIDRYTCNVCRKLYTDPVIHRLCMLSFDRQCIKGKCPEKTCGQKIKEGDLIVNYALLKAVDEYRLRLETPLTYYLILLDTSSSMSYSDALIPFLMGESRFSCALEFLNNFLKQRLKSTTDKVSLVTFDTSTLQRFNFETIDTPHLKTVQNLKCSGKDTALFDSIDFCMEIFEKIKPIGNTPMPQLYLLVVTDGGNNFGKKESEHAEKLAYRSGELQIHGHMIQVGDTNRKRTRRICDVIKYKFNHFNEGNVKDFTASFSNSIKTEIRVEPLPAIVEQPQPAIHQDTISQPNLIFPDVPTHIPIPKIPVRTTEKQKVPAS